MSSESFELRSTDEAGQWLRAQLSRNAQLSADSRAIADGDGFLAFAGLRVDGREFISQACRSGAGAVLLEIGDAFDVSNLPVSVPCRGLPGLRTSAGEVSSAYYGHPSRQMTVFAVTGTNGKTSCAHWLAAGAAQAGQPSAALGTLGTTVFDGKASSAHVDQSAGATLTTPDAVSLQRVFASLLTKKVRTVALEASSIGLTQNRLGATDIDVAVFTNLSRDHLDYHHDMSAYAKAKQQLFAWPTLRGAVVNGDDPASATMLQACAADVASYAFGFEPQRYGAQAEHQVRIVSADPVADRPGAMCIQFDGDLGAFSTTVALLGRFNALNAAAVCVAWHAAGLPFEQAVARLANLRPVAGRMQTIDLIGQPLLVIDYAHTPDALRVVLEALAPIARQRAGKLWLVFGCGGDRDTGKRAAMGAIAEQIADRVALTSDNPRSESPHQILDQIAQGLRSPAWLEELDRAAAIDAVVLAADPSDIVLVAGKGHEDYQEFADRRIAFNDMAVARAALQKRGVMH